MNRELVIFLLDIKIEYQKKSLIFKIGSLKYY